MKRRFKKKRENRISNKPSFSEETKLAEQGYKYIAGIDEAGRGALAGPVVAAAVILPCQPKGAWLQEVNDSKLLKPERREYLFGYILETAVSVGVGVIHHDVIDKGNILKASLMAMKQAVEKLSPPPDSLLIDHLQLPDVSIPQKGIVNGDGRCLSIACASIIAKVTRDRMMMKMENDYPGYGLSKHKGYCTQEHIANLRILGPSPVHRLSFHPVKDLIPWRK